MAVAGAGLLAAAGVAVAGRRRRDTFLVALGGISLTGTVAAVSSATRIVGAVLPYLLLWTSVLPLPAWIGAGAVVEATRAGAARRRSASRLLGVGLVAVVVASGWSALRASLPPLKSATDVAAADRLARSWLADHHARQVRIHLGDHTQWPLAAGVIDRLDGEGVAVTVDAEYTSLFGDQFAPTGREDAALWLAPSNGTPPSDGSLARLGAAGGSVVWAGLTGPS